MHLGSHVTSTMLTRVELCYIVQQAVHVGLLFDGRALWVIYGHCVQKCPSGSAQLSGVGRAVFNSGRDRVGHGGGRGGKSTHGSQLLGHGHSLYSVCPVTNIYAHPTALHGKLFSSSCARSHFDKGIEEQYMLYIVEFDKWSDIYILKI